MQFKLPIGRRARRPSDPKQDTESIASSGRISRLFLHIGLPKTGTTSIQAYCLKNRRHLGQNGILYPTTGLQGPGHMKLSAAFISMFQKRRGVVEDQADNSGFSKYSQSLKKEIASAASNIDSMLISSERFSIVQGEGLERLIDTFENMRVQPILYLRRQDLLAESLHAQAYRVRSPYFRPENLLQPQKTTFRFWDLVEIWRNAFGADNLIVRKFQKRSVTFDFLEALGVRNTDKLPAEFRLNAGLSRDAMEYMRHHTDLQYGTPDYVRVESRLVEYSKIKPTPAQYKRFFSPQQRVQLLENYQEQNRRVASELFGESELFADELPSTNEPWEKYPGLSSAAKRDIEDFIQKSKAA